MQISISMAISYACYAVVWFTISTSVDMSSSILYDVLSIDDDYQLLTDYHSFVIQLCKRDVNRCFSLLCRVCCRRILSTQLDLLDKFITNATSTTTITRFADGFSILTV